jgi:DNA-directed RNA polymerase specialized sigma24 family protein
MKLKKKIDSINDIELELIESGKLKENSNNYVCNKDLYNEFIRFNEIKTRCLEENEPVPKMSDKIGAAIIQIATRRCNSRQFVGYSNNWKEELISNAIMTATIRCHNFDPSKSNNPFAYLTQICNNAILEQLKKEKKNLYVKYKSMEETDGFYGEVDQNVNEVDLQHQMESLPSDQRRQYIDDFEKSNFNKEIIEVEQDTGIFNFC